jgi:N-acylneuraminate cytidylyltransferase/CMP-N,N'-diacetyllegionaminic acid synthase
LISYTIDTAFQCSSLNTVIVSTDSDDIEKEATQCGIKEIIRRPAALATDTASKWDVFKHTVECYESMHKVSVDYIVDMDVTVPLKTSSDVEAAIRLALTSDDTDVVITGYEPERNPYFNMMEVDTAGFARIVKNTPAPIVRRQDAPSVYSLTPAAYVIKKAALYEHEHWSKATCKISPMPRERAIDIDTAFDFKLVECLMNLNERTV